jgi:AraC-like DNA-binding protein
MRPTVQYIAGSASRGWALQIRDEPAFDFTWHTHDDYELTMIREGCGQLFTGDRTAQYGPGYLALFGPRLPHTFVSRPGDGRQVAHVVHFRGELVQRLGSGDEFRPIRGLLDRCAQGVAVVDPPGATKHAAEKLVGLTGARQTIALLDLLAELAEITPTTTLASAAATRPVTATSADRLSAIIGYLDDAFADPVHRDDIAAAVAMSPSSVSRLLRRQLGTTVTDYVNSLRVAAASRALVDTDQAIADIAHDCGFGNLSNFNRQFRHSQHMTPRDYRRAFAPSAAEPAE